MIACGVARRDVADRTAANPLMILGLSWVRETGFDVSSSDRARSAVPGVFAVGEA